MATTHLRLGVEVGTGEPVYVTAREWTMHTAVFGVTGTGKSTLLEQIARQILSNHHARGEGLCLIDRPGTMLDSLIDWQSGCRLQVPNVLMDLSDSAHVIPYSPIRRRAGKAIETIVADAVLALAHTRGEASLDRTTRIELVATNLFHALLLTDCTLAEADAMLDPMENALRDLIVDRLPDQRLQRWWQQIGALSPRQRLAEFASTRSRIARLAAPVLRRMTGQSRSLNLNEVLHQAVVLLASIGARAACSETDADTFFSLLLSDLWNVARDRSSSSPIYTIILDEFHSLITPAVVEGLPQCRKYNIAFVLATQFPAQLRSQNRRMYEEVMGSCRTKISFRVDAQNARLLANDLHVRPQTLTRLEKYHAVVKLVDDPRPRLIRTEPIWPLRAQPPHRDEWVQRQFDSLGHLVLTPEDVDAAIQRRQQDLIGSLPPATEPDLSQPDAFVRHVIDR